MVPHSQSFTSSNGLPGTGTSTSLRSSLTDEGLVSYGTRYSLPAVLRRSMQQGSTKDGGNVEDLYGAPWKDEKIEVYSTTSSEESTNSVDIDSRIDSKYAYVQVFAVFMNACNLGAMLTAYGIYLDSIQNDLNVSLSVVTWPIALMLAIKALAAPWAGTASSRFGSRNALVCGTFLLIVGLISSSYVEHAYGLFLTWGILMGAGLSLILYPSIGVIMQWFRQYKAMALGLALMGSGIGGFVYSLLAAKLIETYGWRDAMRFSIIWVVVFGVFPAVLLRDLKPPRSKKLTLDVHLFKYPRFVFMWLNQALFAFGYATPLIFTVSWASYNDISLGQAAIAAGANSLALGVAQPVLGWLGDHTNRNVVYFVSRFLAGVCVTLFPLCTTAGSLIAINVAYGVAVAARSNLAASIITDWFPTYDPARIAGLSSCGRVLGELVGPVSIAALFAVSSTAAFVVSGVFLILGALSFLVAVIWPAGAERKSQDSGDFKV
eukprot:Clim_evm3s92 gene=Clim_evmTU3s92